jgi:hypothetical protein
MRTLLFLAMSALACAQSHQGQSGNTTYIAAPYTEFCAPSGIGEAIPCGSGAYVHIQNNESGFNAYRVTIRVTTHLGNTFTLTQLQDRTSGWTSIRFKTGHELGRIESVRIVSITKLVTAGDVPIVP